jgi:hypothetical protein
MRALAYIHGRAGGPRWLEELSKQETAMPATQPPKDEGPQSGDDRVEGQPAPMPDEDGPHDVPDEKVIEKTLPAGKAADPGGRGA